MPAAPSWSAAELGLRQRRSEVARLRDTIGALELELERVERGDLGSPTAHLHHAMHPMPPDATRYGRLVEFWSAISIGILLLAEVAMLVDGHRALVHGACSWASVATCSSKQPFAVG